MWASLNLVGCEIDDVIEVDDDTTDDEINDMQQDWLSNHTDGGWEEIEESD